VLRYVALADKANVTPTHLAPGPLSPEDLIALAAVRKQARKVHRAATIAMISGWSMAAFAGLTFIAVLFGDVVALVLGVFLSALAWNEIRGGALLKKLDPRAPRRLGFNQIGLGLLIVVYAAWSLSAALRNPALGTLAGNTGDASTDALVRDLAHALTYGVYGGMAIVGVVVPGLTSWYYFSRGRLVTRLLDDSPSWAIETIRIAA
jgi:hypothetical protein